MTSTTRSSVVTSKPSQLGGNDFLQVCAETPRRRGTEEARYCFLAGPHRLSGLLNGGAEPRSPAGFLFSWRGLHLLHAALNRVGGGRTSTPRAPRRPTAPSPRVHFVVSPFHLKRFLS